MNSNSRNIKFNILKSNFVHFAYGGEHKQLKADVEQFTNLPFYLGSTALTPLLTDTFD